MTGNSNRVTQKQLYQEIMALEGRLGSKIDAVLAAVNENRTANAKEYACLQAGFQAAQKRLGDLDGPNGRVANLEGSDNRWKAFTALLGALGGAVTGFLTGRQG
jgi:hypothetical protein